MSSDPFTYRLLEWHQLHARVLPWKEDSDPYKIWLSEIILQQTRVNQGMPYYLKFIEAFPDVDALARASEDEVLKLWEGLGYYSRARNLHFTARMIMYDLNGKFPNSYEGLLKLKGVGPYTAAAIASFAYGLSHAVVDGNVTRVLSRYVGIEKPVDISSTKKEINFLADNYLDRSAPGDYNQAMMDFGALQCVPAKPDCHACPLKDNCYAFAKGKVHEIPVKQKKVVKKEITLDYHIIFDESQVLIKKRTHQDIWKGLYDFLMLPKEVKDIEKALKGIFKSKENFTTRHLSTIGPYTHILTHRRIKAFFHLYLADLEKKRKLVKHPYYLVERKKLSNFAFPILIKKHIIDAGVLNGINIFDNMPDKE